MSKEAKIKIALEVATVNVNGVRNLGLIYDMPLSKATRKIVKDYIEFYIYTEGDVLGIDRSKFEDKLDYDCNLTSISVPIKEFYHRLFKQACVNQNIKMKHMIRGLFEFYSNGFITARYNFETQNILLQEWIRGNI